ncbi:MAG: hypothetical protein DWQ04_22600, partial [Chloroflexi bacterium]
ADRLAISITERSDDAPVLTYYADIVAQSPELDLAVLKISSRLDGKSIARLKLPHIPVGDSDDLELGDILSIFGYPGIGGETVTFTSGSVAGFTKQKGVRARRAWIKTDATIAGGNSGGTAVNHDGKLVGIPTQAAAGEGIVPVDARPVVDTNKDGRVDQRDTPMAIGGFINGLRPVNLAFPLLRKAGVKIGGKKATSSGRKTTGSRPASSAAPKSVPRRSGVKISNLVFCSRVTRDGRPVNPASMFRSGRKALFVVFDFEGMRKGTKWSQVWSVNGQKVMDQEGKWEDGPRGRKALAINNNQGLPDGQYHLVITVRNQIVAEGEVMMGRHAEDSDTQISGKIVDQRNGRGIKDALVIVLKPGVRANDFVRNQRPDMSVTSTKTGRNGRFTFPKQLPKGTAYGLVVVARGYRDMVIEGALRIGAHAPEKAEINPLGLIRG